MQRINTATKAVDLFGVGKHGFRNGNLAAGVPATDFDAEWFNGVQEELLGIIEEAGFVPSAADRTQLRQAIAVMFRKRTSSVASAGGTADAITADFSPDVAAYTDGMVVHVRAAAANTSTTPTFKADALAAKTIVKGNNQALVAGDIAGAGHWLVLKYDQALDKFVLLNPSQGVNALGSGQTWQPPGGGRSIGVTYTNTTGKPIQVAIRVASTSSQVWTLTVGGVGITTLSNNGVDGTIFAVIPPGATYVLTGGTVLNAWAELR